MTVLNSETSLTVLKVKTTRSSDDVFFEKNAFDSSLYRLEKENPTLKKINLNNCFSIVSLHV
jgi:hypothetical protein